MSADPQLINLIARTLDPLSFRRYKEGDCLPRGEECSTVEKVNQVQEWRQRAAEGRARAVIKALDKRLIPEPPELAGTVPLVLYFADRAEADEFIALVREAFPNMQSRNL